MTPSNGSGSGGQHSGSPGKGGEAPKAPGQPADKAGEANRKTNEPPSLGKPESPSDTPPSE